MPRRTQAQGMNNFSERGPRPWRVLFDGPQSGARNMATDEALARAHLERASQASPTLRFYEWEPACLSLGRLQKLDGPLQVLGERRVGLDWVRRPSGGRGVWHGAEVTYSLSLALDDLPVESRSVVGAYKWLSQPLLSGLEVLGVRAELASSRGENRGARNCFLSSSQADAIVDGRKLIGGAQCRFEKEGRTSVLQHGSILIELDGVAWSSALGEASDEASLKQHALSLRQLGIGGSVPEIRVLVQNSIARALVQHKVEAAQLSPREEELRDELEARKYLQPDWNVRGRLVEP